MAEEQHIHIGKEIEARINQLNMNKTEFAKLIGTSKQNVNRILEKSSLDTNILQKYGDVLGCNFFTLYTNTSTKVIKIDNPSKRVFAVGSTDDEVSMIPVLPIDALATFISNPSMVESSELDYDPVVLTTQEKRDIKNLCIINVHGDSMSPVINNHSRVLAKRVPRPQWGNVGGIVGVSYNDTSDGFNDPYFVVKNVGSNKLYSENYIILESENKDYGNMTVQLADILAMWECLRIVSQSLR